MNVFEVWVYEVYASLINAFHDKSIKRNAKSQLEDFNARQLNEEEIV